MEFQFFHVGISFLIGVFTGGFGEYYGLKYTDQRRKKEYQIENKQNYLNAKKNMPLLISGISKVLNKNPNGRIFIESGYDDILFLDNTFIDDILDLKSKLITLEEYGFIQKEFDGKDTKYYITNKFFNLITKSKTN